MQTLLMRAPLMSSDGTFNLGSFWSRPTGASCTIPLSSPPSSPPLHIPLINHSPCLSRWTCGWWARPPGCGRSLQCRRQAWVWGGHWTGEGDSPGWRRPARRQRNICHSDTGVKTKWQRASSNLDMKEISLLLASNSEENAQKNVFLNVRFY